MSYTPEDEVISEELIRNLRKNIDELRAAMFARIRSPRGWSAAHRQHLASIQQNLMTFEMDLNYLASGSR